MKLSTTVIYSIVLVLAGKVIAEDGSVTSGLYPESTADIVGTSQGVEFPFSDDAIIEAVKLGDDVVPIVLKDSVFFINSTIVEAEYDAHTTDLQKRDPEAWRWITYFRGQPFYKRETEGNLAKRSAEADADAWKWITYFRGQPFYNKREVDGPLAKRSADAEAEAWRWITYFRGQPFY